MAFTLEPSKERYLCFAATTEQELVIDGYHSAGAPFLHHVVFSRATAPEPEGTSECDILFRYTWEPLFLTRAGESELNFPRTTAARSRPGRSSWCSVTC